MTLATLWSGDPQRNAGVLSATDPTVEPSPGPTLPTPTPIANVSTSAGDAWQMGAGHPPPMELPFRIRLPKPLQELADEAEKKRRKNAALLLLN